MLFGSGFANAIGQCFSTQSLRPAPATAVAPFYYLLLVWAMAYGFLIRGDVPSAASLLRSAIVVGSGFFLFWREARLQRAIRGAFTSPALDRANCANRMTHFRHLSALARREPGATLQSSRKSLHY
jgi:hypothetical protein